MSSMKYAFMCKVYCDFLWRQDIQCGKNIALFCYRFSILSITMYHRINLAYTYSISSILHLIIIRSVVCMFIDNGPHIWQLIVKIMFQMQSHELNSVVKSFIFHIQQPMTINIVVYCYIRWIYSISQSSGCAVT